MRYYLRIARMRPESGVDTHSAVLDASSIEAAVSRSVQAVDAFLGDRPGVATLTSSYRGLVWTHRQKMPSIPWP